MEFSRSPLLIPSPSPKRELQGPRPTPLKVCKDSCKIKKPHGAPPPQYRPPVIIYTVSPTIIHTKPSDFMALVQRLTGASSSTVDIPSSDRALSPAARLATLKAQATDGERSRKRGLNEEFDQLGIGGSFPGILSPLPSSLPPIPPNFFLQSADPNMVSFMHQQSPPPVFTVSPNNFLSTPAVPSPGAYWDLFNQYQDF